MRNAIRDVRTDLGLAATDCALVTVALTCSVLLHLRGQPSRAQWEALVPVLLVAVFCYVCLLAARGLYGRAWEQAGAMEAWALAVTCLRCTFVLVALGLVMHPSPAVPTTVLLNAGALTLLFLAGARFHVRLRAQHGPTPEAGTRVALVGSLEQARAIVGEMRQHPSAGLSPAVVVNDDPLTWRRYVAGVPVSGPLMTLVEKASTHGASEVLLLPGALNAAQVRLVERDARRAGLPVRSLPSLSETCGRRAALRDIRDLSLEDLLGRDQIHLDETKVRSIIVDRRVLITGAGGSIGAEIAAQVSRLEPRALVLLDHDETHLHDALAKLAGPATSVLGDIRDAPFVERLMHDLRPEVVFHAAAHKHVPILENHPVEAVRTNVYGTQVLVEAAQRVGTSVFVAISTDKAVCPRSVMGATKRIAEQLVTGQSRPGARYCAVRFGNVLGSRGSVVPTFIRQVQEGGPVTVTDPEMTRFFMTTHEAVSLVLQAASLAQGSEIFMLDMGEPIRILDLAERIIDMAGLVPGKDIQIEFTGLRPGEKLTEELADVSEKVEPTGHPKIARLTGARLADDLLVPAVHQLVRHARDGDEEATYKLLFALARRAVLIDLDAPARPVTVANRRTGSLLGQVGA